MSLFKTSILAGAMLLSSLPAFAQDNCAASISDHTLQKLTFSDSSVVNVMSRKDNVLTYAVDTARGRMTVSAYGGLFTQKTTGTAGVVTFTYDQDLSAAFPLTPGKTFTATAVMTRPGQNAPETFRSEMKVAENGLFRLDGCDYPVIKIETRHTLNGVTTTEIARYYNADSMMSLRSTITSFMPDPAQPKTVEYIATTAK